MIAKLEESRKTMKEQVSISMDSDILRELREVAKRRGISLSALFQRMAILYLYEYEKRGRSDEKPSEREE